jgi:LacI family repressor for deo operon, udp, cdd, tsx, nupC, and nupG
LAVSGYDNLDISTVIIPHVTTIDQQHEAYAREALALLLDGEHGDPLRVIEPKLIIRDSTAGDIQVRLK